MATVNREPNTDLESLEWDDIKHWTSKNYDFGYDVTIKYQPGWVMET